MRLIEKHHYKLNFKTSIMKQSNFLKSIIAIVAVFSLPVLKTYSQDMTMDDVKLVQQAFGRDKKVLLGQYLQLNDAQSKKFWPIYDTYEEARRKLGRDRILIIDDYAKHYDSLTNAKADQLVKRLLKNDDDFAKLQKTYYEKVKTATSALVGAQFLQYENYIQTSIRSEVQESIPFIGEIKKQAPPKG
jgi:hypothetical protein